MHVQVRVHAYVEANYFSSDVICLVCFMILKGFLGEYKIVAHKPGHLKMKNRSNSVTIINFSSSVCLKETYKS